MILGACAEEDTASAQRAELGALLAELSLRPFGSEAAEPSTVRSKGGPAYAVATGIADVPRDPTLDRVRTALQRLGWETREDRAVDHFLGWEIRAVKANDVMLVSVGSQAVGVPDSPYRPLADRAY